MSSRYFLISQCAQLFRNADSARPFKSPHSIHLKQTNKLLSTRSSKRNVHFAFLQIGRAGPTGSPTPRICVPPPAARSRPPLPAWPRPCLCLKPAGGRLQRPEGAGGWWRAGCGRRHQRAPFCAAPGSHWIGSVSFAVGVGGASRDPGSESSRPGAVADGAHFAAAGCALGLLRRAGLLGAASPGLWAPAQPRRSLLPIPSLLSPYRLLATPGSLLPRIASTPSLTPAANCRLSRLPARSCVVMGIRGMLRVAVLLLLIRTWLAEGNDPSPTPEFHFELSPTVPEVILNLFNW